MKIDIAHIVRRLEGIRLDRKKIILIVLMSAAILYADGFYGLRFQYKATVGLCKKASQMAKDLATFKKEFANLSSYKSTQEKMLTRAKRLVAVDQKQQFVEYLYDLANKNQVKILQWKPAADTKVKEETVNRIKLIPYAMTMDLLCGYHELGKFINGLERGKFFVAVTDVKITPGALDAFQQSAVLTLKIYAKK
jgi:hypothetical protein